MLEKNRLTSKRVGHVHLSSKTGILLNCTASSALPFKSVLTNETDLPKTPRRTTWNAPCRNNDLSTFKMLGLPEHVVQHYQETRKIKSLYKWQHQCLQDVKLLQGSNFILSLPTGAGKTLVAELLMLRCTLYCEKSCILILPFIAIVVSLSVFEEGYDVCIEEYASTRGRIPPLNRSNQSIYVCTIEKANILINSLISEDRMHEIGLVIVDEMHMLADGRRGFILEQCLTKLILVSKAQIIGLSATLSSIDKLKTFLQANVFSTDFRPVTLIENIKVGDEIYSYDNSDGNYKFVNKVKRILPKQQDPDNLIALIDEIIPQKSVLIFCQSRQAAENLCQWLLQLMPKRIREFQKEKKETVIQQIVDSNDGVICPIIKRGLSAGVCYHHSGLTRDERILVESSFRDGVISVICSTSTLATGVNLPARRIIIRSTKIGASTLGKTQYLQMIGRAGRAGLDTEGDCYTFVDNKELFHQMRNKELPPLVSGMNDVKYLESFVLDLLALNICKTRDDLERVLQISMYDSTVESHISFLKTTTDSLILKQLLKETFEITELGMAVSKANLPPEESVSLYKNLMLALDQGLVLSSRFHLLCIIVPYDIELASCNYNLFYDEYQKLTEGERELLSKWEITENEIVNSMSICTRLRTGSAFQRTYIAFMLRHLWSIEASPATVAERFQVSRGWLNSTLQSVCTYANQISRFCTEIPKFFAYRQLFPDLIQQLRITTHKELTQFLELDCIKLSRAQSLYNAGYRNIGDVAKSTPDELIKAVHLLNQFQAERIISSAKILFRDLLAEKAQELQQIGASTQDIQSKCRPSADNTSFRGELKTPQSKRRRSSQH